MSMNQPIYSKIAGCLIAGALGDALGYPIEFQPWSLIKVKYGPSGLDHPVLTDGKAIISDDTQMTLFTNEGMILGHQARQNSTANAGKTVEEYIWQAYLCWLKTQHVYWVDRSLTSIWENESELLSLPEMNEARAPGNTCLAALDSGKMGTILKRINQSKGCGGVMRTAPCGFTKEWGEPLETGAAAAAITHGHAGGWAPGGILSDLVCRLIYGKQQPLETTFLESLDAARRTWDDKELPASLKIMEKAIELSHTDLPEIAAVHTIGGGWVGDEALAIAFYACLKHENSLPEALLCAVNHSGDSDSTGAIAGNIMGALYGLEAIPADWMEVLELRDTILDQARKAYETAAGNNPTA